MREFIYFLETADSLQRFWVLALVRWLHWRRKLHLTFLPMCGPLFVLGYEITSNPAYLLLTAGGACVLILAIVQAVLRG